MHRPLRVIALLLAAVVAGISLVSTASTATAAGPGRGPSLEKQRAQVLRAVGRVDVAVTRATDARRLRGLDPEVRDAVVANADADHAGLDDLAVAARAAGSRAELAAVTTALRGYRPESYAVALGALRAAVRLGAGVADAREELADDPDAQEALDEVDALIVEVVDAALAITATSGRADERAVKAALVAARRALEAVTGA